jgi:uncharacterized protein involved in propanediol utilization
MIMSSSRAHLRLVTPVPPDPATRAPSGRAGYGRCAAHHGEILRGAFWLDGPHRPATRALVTLPYPDLTSTAVARLTPDSNAVSVEPAAKSRTALAARLALAELRLPGGVRVQMSGNIPAGWGLGSSTADVVAVVRAVADAASRQLPDASVARLAATAELAGSDPVMFGDQVTLFAHREGRVLDTLGPLLPPLLVVGCNAAAGTTVDTSAHPPADYGPGELDQLGALLGILRKAVRTGDATLVGAVATRSAAINQRYLPLPVFGELRRVATTSGAVGVQVAHSGTVAGLLYDANDPRATRRAERGRAELSRLGVGRTWTFSPYAEQPLARVVGR